MSKRESDGSSVTTNPAEFESGLARRRHAEARFRNPRNRIDVKREHFKSMCPWCHSANVVMSLIDPSRAAALPPDKGDLIKCDACRHHHVVTEINLNGVVKTEPVDIPT